LKKIFISYSWDGEEHQQWVKKLADDLEAYEEFHIVLDQYDLDATTDKNLFMEKAVFETDVILVICTETYAKKADSRKGGVGIETFLTTIKHWEESEQNGKSNIIAITRGDRTKSIPRYLKGKFAISFNNQNYNEKFQDLLNELNKANELSNERPQKTRSIKKESATVYDFNKVDDILALLYKNRKKIDENRDYSANKRIRYEYWEVQQLLEKTYILVLFNHINIQQTIKNFVERNQYTPKHIAVIRINKGEAGYIEKQFQSLQRDIKVTEFRIDDLVWNSCIDQEWKKENNVLEEKFFIDQKLYSDYNDSNQDKGLSIDYIYNHFIKKGSMPILMLFAAGGVGKSTLCSILNNKVNENTEQKAILIQSEDIRENINKEVSKNYTVENIYQLYEIYIRLASSTKSVLNEKQFNLGVLSGRIIVIIDGLDEIVSLFQENFNLIKFLESLTNLNQQMGNSKIIITSRLHVLQSHPTLEKNPDIELAYLKGFEEEIWKKYLEQRFSTKLDSKSYIQKVEKLLEDVVQTQDEISYIVPFFLDLICEVVEDEDNGDYFIVDTISKDYQTNNENIDYLIHAILKREITRQKFNVPLINLVDLFKELSINYGDRFTHENLKYMISLYFDSSNQEELYQKILLNPLLADSIDSKVIKFKYDFLSNYFICLYLIEHLQNDYAKVEISKDLIIQLAKLYDGNHVILGELIKFFSKDKQKCITNSKKLIKKLISYINTETYNITECKRALSGMLYLNQKVHGEGLSKNQRTTIIKQLYTDSKIEYMYIWGDYYPIDFSNMKIWSSEFHKFTNFCKSTFTNTFFYHSLFEEIPISEKCTNLTTCTFDTCSVGSLQTIINAQEENYIGKQKNIEENLKIFFRSFMDRGNFVYKDINNITIPRMLSSKPKKFIDKLEGTVLEKEEHKLNKSYGIIKDYQKDVISLIKDNHITPKMKKFIDSLI